MPPVSILLIGASGYFVSLMLEELLSYTPFSIVAAARDLRRLNACASKWPETWLKRVERRQVDLFDPKSLEAIFAEFVNDLKLAISAAGPYQRLPHHLLRLCLERNIHYVDISDDRTFVKAVRAMTLNESAHSSQLPAVCTGWSSMPALSAVLTELATEGMESIDQIRIQIAPGNRAPRGSATIESLLDSIGRTFQIYRNEQWVNVTGWTDPQTFIFPPPVGARLGYLVDVPDHELFPELFKAATVEFRVGAELNIFNHACSLLAALAKSGMRKNWRSLVPLVQKSMVATCWFGHDWGAVGVECSGIAGGSARRSRACIVTDHKGQSMPVMPAVVISSKLLSAESSLSGLVQPRGWLTRDELERECRKRNHRLVVTED